MVAPIRDHLAPRDPRSSPLLCATRDSYFLRLSVAVYPSTPGFGQAGWIVSEDVNVEHLLYVFTSIDPNASATWDACYHFIDHPHWHKPRQTMLGSKIEALADDDHWKPTCLLVLSHLFGRVGNFGEQKRLLVHILELERQQGNDSRVTQTSKLLSDVNRSLRSYRGGDTTCLAIV
jgi:hypothetical protein